MVDRRRRAVGPSAGPPRRLRSSIDRIVYVEALVLLPLIAASLRALGLRRTRSWLRRVSALGRRPRTGRHTDVAAHTAEVVAAAAATGPYRPSCLRRALALEAVLAQRGLDAELKLGVGRGTGTFSAHAWVEHHGVPLATGPDPDTAHESYSVLASLPTKR